MKFDDVSSTPLPRLAARQPESHKGDYGRALVVGGSRGMSGAIALAGKAALRSGAGLVTLAVPESIQAVAAAYEPSYMTRGLPDAQGQLSIAAADEVLELAQSVTAIGLGPGIGRSSTVTHFVTRLYREVKAPMVVDADALFALAEAIDALESPGGVRVLTPHPGEFTRLCSESYNAAHRVDAAAALALRDQSNKTIIVLKGHHTVVTDGRRVCINSTGNPGMATGGTGDVLTGIITALVCQGLPPFDAARLGVYVHGRAGDVAAERLGHVSMIASDLLECLPEAFMALN